jgi:hypothetical protein
MDTRVRDLIFTPLVERNFSEIIPDFTMELPDGPVTAPAQISFDGDKFRFAVHFVDGTPLQSLISPGKSTFTKDDTFTVRGQLASEIAFECTDVYPPSQRTTRSRGTVTVILESSRMHLPAEGADEMDTAELSELLGTHREGSPEVSSDFRSHSIFHGPKLRLPNAGSETLHKNDFLGEASESSLDTHVFKGQGYEGALIQKGQELHLHLRSKESNIPDEGNWPSIVRSVERALAFTHGFHPWPAYRETRLNHRVSERSISSHLGLGQTNLSPISKSMWMNIRETPADPLHQIIPTVAAGLVTLPAPFQEGLETMLWQFRSMELSDLPGSTKLLMICAILDGTMKLLAGKTDPTKSSPTNKVWKAGCAAAGLSWDKWGDELFELYGKHRQHLAHGWLWIPSSDNPEVYFADYPKLCGGLNTLVAAACRYEGRILTNAFRSGTVIIKSLKGDKP